jgi:hypothetical protein
LVVAKVAARAAVARVAARAAAARVVVATAVVRAAVRAAVTRAEVLAAERMAAVRAAAVVNAVMSSEPKEPRAVEAKPAGAGSALSCSYFRATCLQRTIAAGAERGHMRRGS